MATARSIGSRSHLRTHVTASRAASDSNTSSGSGELLFFYELAIPAGLSRHGVAMAADETAMLVGR